MKIKRLILVLAMTVALLLSLCACNKEETKDNTPKTEESSSTEASESKVEESTSEEESSNQEESTSEEESSNQEESKNEESGDCTPLLYRVEDNDGSVLYLFGTIHLGDDRMVFPDYVMDAYNESDFLCVEADMIAFQQDMSLQMEAVKKMLCEPGKSAKDYLGEELYNSAVAILEEKDLYMQAFDYYRPIMWESLLNQALIMNSDLSTEHGADLQLLTMAKEDGKEVREAEGVLHQYDLLISAGDEPIILTVEQLVKYKDIYVEQTNLLYKLWLTGNESLLKKAIADDYSELSDEDAATMENYNNIIVDQRNLAMADLAEDYLEEGKTGFYAVGAAHIVGDGALAQLLADRGYTVTIVE